MLYSQTPDFMSFVKEKDNSKEYLQMDEIMKKLFTLSNKIPIIDFLNAIYGDDLSYDAKITYNNTEIVNSNIFLAQFKTFRADMFITAIYKDKTFEYAIEFQTAFDKDIAIRIFRYSFERAIRLDYYRNKNLVRLQFPEPYIILLEEERNVSDELTLELLIPKGQAVRFNVKILKYWNYNLDKLYRENKYLLYPLQVFKLRKEMESLRAKGIEGTVMEKLKEKLKYTIEETLKAIDKAYEDGKIELTDYDEMITILINLNSYLLRSYKIKGEIEEEVARMIKTFYDPKVEERGIEKGIEQGIKLIATNMIKDGESNEKINRYTGLDEKVIMELRKLIEGKGEH